MEGEDFRGEGMEVCRESGEGDVFGGFLVVVAELFFFIFVRVGQSWMISREISCVPGSSRRLRASRCAS